MLSVCRLSTLIDAPTDDPAAAASIAEVSRLMRFRADHFASLFDFGVTADKGAAKSLKLARVGVLASSRHDNEGRDQVVPRPADTLRTLGVGYRIETEVTILEWGSLGPGSALELLLCDGMLTLSSPAAAAIGRWVRAGGWLVSTADCALVDMVGRPYPWGLLQAEFPGGSSTGAGRAVFVPEGTLAQNKTAVDMMLGMKTVVSPRCSRDAKSTAWETSAWRNSSGSVAIHFTNATAAGGESPYAALVLAVKMPAYVGLEHGAAAAPGPTATAVLWSPYEPCRSVVVVDSGHDDGVLHVTVPTPPAYGVVVIGTQADHHTPPPPGSCR